MAVGCVGAKHGGSLGRGEFWDWASLAICVRLCTDGERCYSQSLWAIALECQTRARHPQVVYRQVWLWGWKWPAR
ncbi:hypothetical protein [Rubidibacter lacunae]|uniref:hypothetical protein n=1 Tax=Rubidibacter lacunae TaxID=582514 RepID=UPI0012EC43C0|nr:hypothetical protein [Rubidibacter lacunae]